MPKEPSQSAKVTTIVGGLIGFAALFSFIIINETKNKQPGAPVSSSSIDEQADQPIVTNAELASKIGADAISSYAEKDRKTYPKLFAKLGDRLFEVEALGRKAAVLTLKTGKCDRVAYVDVSDRSTRQELQFFVDCENSTRVRVSENEIAQGIASDVKTVSEQDQKAMARDLQQIDERKAAYADRSRQSLWIVKSQEGIAAKLKDADSAEFRNVHFYSGSGRPLVCGEVNAKNGFGGYGGFEPFVASGTDLAFLASEMSSPNEMAKILAQLCVRSPTDTE